MGTVTIPAGLRQFLGRRLGGVVAEPRHTVRGSPERCSSPPENDKSAVLGESFHLSLIHI